MKIIYPHKLTVDEVYSRINKLLPALQEKYADKISNPKTSWNSDNTKMDYSMTIMGFITKGIVVINDNEIILNGSIPLLAMGFSGKIKEMINQQLDEMLN